MILSRIAANDRGTCIGAWAISPNDFPVEGIIKVNQLGFIEMNITHRENCKQLKIEFWTDKKNELQKNKGYVSITPAKIENN